MNLIESLFWAIFGALLSTIFSVGIPLYASWIRYRKKPEILGTWKSAYQDIDEPESNWVNEDLIFYTRFGKLRMKNKNSSKGYCYSAKCRLVPGDHIIGEWISVKPGANAKGGLMLTVCAQGDRMYGYWVGSDNVGARRYGRWVLARKKQGIEEAKNNLNEMRKSRLQGLAN